MSQIVHITVGIPGSGKSTWRDDFRKQNPDYVLIHPDSIRIELTGSEENQNRNAEVFKLAFARLDAALKDGLNVIFDACSQNRERRKPILQIARKRGAEARATVFNVSLEVAKQRNAKRARKVPEFVLDRMYKGWETPTLEEGFGMVHFK